MERMCCSIPFNDHFVVPENRGIWLRNLSLEPLSYLGKYACEEIIPGFCGVLCCTYDIDADRCLTLGTVGGCGCDNPVYLGPVRRPTVEPEMPGRPSQTDPLDIHVAKCGSRFAPCTRIALSLWQSSYPDFHIASLPLGHTTRPSSIPAWRRGSGLCRRAGPGPGSRGSRCPCRGRGRVRKPWLRPR